MTLTLLSLTGLQPNIFPAHATELLPVCAVTANRYNHYSHMAAFLPDNWRGFNEAASGTAWTLNQTRTANTVNEITGITNTTGPAWASPAYDAAGNMSSIPQPANMAAAYSATYDAWNRMVALASGGTTVQQNQYDARNFRTIRTTTAITETRHFYFTAGWRCIEERLETLTTPDVQSVWGVRYIDDLVRRDRSADQLYTLQDANWNVTSIVNSAGAAQERYSYAAYGQPAFLTGGFGARPTSSYAWETLYCGYRYDAGSGVFLVRYRIFQPLLGVWIRRDPIGYRAGLSLYGYAPSQPYTGFDPIGLDASEEYIITDAPVGGSSKPLKDENRREYGSLNLTDINCIGHATGAEASIQVNPDVSVEKILFEQGYDCEKGKSAKTCVSDCKGKVCAMVYLYVTKNNKAEMAELIKTAKNKLGARDPYTIGIGSFGGVDIHGLMGVGIDKDEVCEYTFVPENLKKERTPNGKLKYKIERFKPTDKQPEYFADQDRILGKWCCCNKFKDRK